MLADLLLLARRRWRAILAIFVAVNLLATAVAFLTPPVYEGTTLFSYMEDEKSSGGLASIAGQFAGLTPLMGLDLSESATGRTEAIATLASRQFATQFIERYELLPALFPDLWDGTAGRWTVEGDDVPTLADAYKVFDEDVRRVSEDKLNGLITVTMLGDDPVRAAEWANAYVRDGDALLRERAQRDSEFAIAYLRKKIADSDLVEIRLAVSRVLEAEISKATLANGREAYAFHVIDPAIAAEPDQQVWPNRLLIIALGLTLGLALGVSYALLAEDLARGG